MNRRKLISLLTAVCLIISCFAGAVSVSAEEAALELISAASVTAAVLNDAAGVVEAVATSNAVEAALDDGIITVKVTTTELKEHTNGADAEGFWTGFAVVAPEGAVKMKGTMGTSADLTLENAEAIAVYENVTEDGKVGAAFYADAGSADAKKYAMLQWCDADGNAISAPTAFVMDLSGVTLDIVKTDITISALDPLNKTVSFNGVEDGDDVSVDFSKIKMYLYEEEVLQTEVTKANVCDSFDQDAKVYDSYEVEYDEEYGDVKITMTGLVMHKNGSRAPGYWTGFTVKAPEDAKYVSYYKSDSNSRGFAELDANDKDLSFYFDVTSCGTYEYVTVQWYKDEVTPISGMAEYYVDLSEVECKIPDPSKVEKANVCDYDNPNEPVYAADSYKVSYENGTVVLEATDLKAHKNENGGDGYWIGFAVKAPEGVTHYTYGFEGNNAYEPVALEEGEDEIAFYINAADMYAKQSAWVRWYTDAETPYSPYREYYNIDITKVDLDVADEALTVAAATIQDSENPAKVLCDAESYKATVDGGIIKLEAKNLKTHVNGEGELGAWVGTSVSAPEGAAYLKYVFVEDGTADWDYARYISCDEPVSFYADAFDPTPKTEIMLQWFDENYNAITNIKSYRMDISGVDYKVKNEPTLTIGKANIVDRANPETAPYESYNVAGKNGVIKLSADKLMVHENGEGDQGAWIGFTVSAPEGAAYLKYDFDSWTEWSYASQIEETEDVSFYVDADGYLKDELMLQWFDENGNALTNIKEYTIDAEDVNVYKEERYFNFEALFSGIELTGDDAKFYNLVPNQYDLNADEDVETVSTEYYVFADVEAKSGTVEGETVFFRDKNAEDGIDTAILTAAPDNGYTFAGWYMGGEKVGSTTSYEIKLDDYYYLYAEFDKNKNLGGGGLQAGGDTSNKGAAEIGQSGEASDSEDKNDNSAVAAPTLGFNDVASSAWYYDVVKAAVEKGLMNGVSATQFAPETSITRGMFVTILYRLAGEPEVSSAAAFSDVPVSQYYADAVAWASANGIVNGVSADSFAPNASITREQMAAIIYRYATTAGIEAANSGEVSYLDSASISAYATDAVVWATNAGILAGNSDGTFAPLRTAKRSEAAAIFVRLMDIAQ